MEDAEILRRALDGETRADGSTVRVLVNEAKRLQGQLDRKAGERDWLHGRLRMAHFERLRKEGWATEQADAMADARIASTLQAWRTARPDGQSLDETDRLRLELAQAEKSLARERDLVSTMGDWIAARDAEIDRLKLALGRLMFYAVHEHNEHYQHADGRPFTVAEGYDAVAKIADVPEVTPAD